MFGLVVAIFLFKQSAMTTTLATKLSFAVVGVVAIVVTTGYPVVDVVLVVSGLIIIVSLDEYYSP